MNRPCGSILPKHKTALLQFWNFEIQHAHLLTQHARQCTLLNWDTQGLSPNGFGSSLPGMNSGSSGGNSVYMLSYNDINNSIIEIFLRGAYTVICINWFIEMFFFLRGAPAPAVREVLVPLPADQAPVLSSSWSLYLSSSTNARPGPRRDHRPKSTRTSASSSCDTLWPYWNKFKLLWRLEFLLNGCKIAELGVDL